MGDAYDAVRKDRKAPREVDVVEWAMLLAFVLVGLTALIGTLHQLLS
jgi:hypothetical protein